MDPSIDDFATTTERLTNILVNGGPYAVLAVMIGLVLLSMYFAKVAANEADRKHFRQVNFVALGMAIVVGWVVLSGGYRTPSEPVAGVILGLTDRPAQPEAAGGEPSIVQQVGLKVSGVPFYRWRTSNPAGSQDWHWMIRSEVGQRRIEMRFFHSYSLHRSGPAPTSLSGRRQQVESGRLVGDFVIDLNALNYRWPKSVEVEYRPDQEDPVRTLGRLSLKTPDGPRPLEWLDNGTTGPTQVAVKDAGGISSRLRTALSGLLGRTLHAQSIRGQDTPRHESERLRRDLASGDAVVESQAVKALVGQGAAAYGLIFRMLDPAALDGLGRTERVNLAHGAWGALRAVEADTTSSAVPDSVLERAAMALVWAGDHRAATDAFEQLTDPAALADTVFFYRAQVLSLSERYDQALESYRAFLDTADDNVQRSITHQNIALIHYRQGDMPRAVAEWRRSLAEHPDNPDALNNLAWAERTSADRAELREALRLVDRALALEPGVPEFIHTKACVMIRLGRWDEGMTLLEDAAKRAPWSEQLQSDWRNAQARGAGSGWGC